MRELIPVASAVEAAARVGLRAAGKAVLAESNARAPKDEGDLIKTGRVNIDDLTVQVSYSSIYAVPQHEALDWRHDGGGQAKFLESAASDVDIGRIVADHVRRELGG